MWWGNGGEQVLQALLEVRDCHPVSGNGVTRSGVEILKLPNCWIRDQTARADSLTNRQFSSFETFPQSFAVKDASSHELSVKAQHFMREKAIFAARVKGNQSLSEFNAAR